MYLLDTCVISELVKPRPSASVVEWVEAQPELELFLSVLTVGEIEEGVAALSAGKKRDALLAWARGSLPERFAGRVLAVDLAVAAAWGEFRGRSRQSLPVVDGLIAATARVHGLTVVTRNTADLRRFDVPVVDPWK
jgi:hypothetical protein